MRIFLLIDYDNYFTIWDFKNGFAAVIIYSQKKVWGKY